MSLRLKVRFSLLTALLFVGACALILGVFSGRATRQRMIVSQLMTVGIKSKYVVATNSVLPLSWRVRIFDNNYYQNVGCLVVADPTKFNLFDFRHINLSTLDHIECLHLCDIPIADDDLVALVSPRKSFVKSLLLRNTQITDESLHEISKCENLRYLDISGTSVSDDGAISLLSLKNLEYLDLSDTDLTDASIGPMLASFAKLEFFCADNTEITDLSLVHIANAGRIKDFSVLNTSIGRSLSGNPKSDGAGSRAWQRFQSLKGLEYIDKYDGTETQIYVPSPTTSY